MTQALLSLGSNINPEHYLRAAAQDIRQEFSGAIFSSVYRTPAIGFEGADFLNAAASIETDWSVERLDQWLHDLEAKHGRVRGPQRFSSRTLDVDIVFFCDLTQQGPGHLQIPRDELKHEFVLRPLADIAPDYRHPLIVKSLSELWSEWLDQRDGFCEAEVAGLVL
jgi:2-amino-4-hydroxy-6-hydroxymethyldihydropteridine diphosphokinase